MQRLTRIYSPNENIFIRIGTRCSTMTAMVHAGRLAFAGIQTFTDKKETSQDAIE